MNNKKIIEYSSFFSSIFSFLVNGGMLLQKEK